MTLYRKLTTSEREFVFSWNKCIQTYLRFAYLMRFQLRMSKTLLLITTKQRRLAMWLSLTIPFDFRHRQRFSIQLKFKLKSLKTRRAHYLENCSEQHTGTKEMTKRGHSLQFLESTSLPSPTPLWRKSRPHQCYVADWLPSVFSSLS